MAMNPNAGVAGAQGVPPQQSSGEPEALRNLMINYIPTTIDEPQLRQIFEMYGPTESVKIVNDRETRTSKGYGFVKYRYAFSAAHAIQYLNGYPLLNKRLKVAYANQAEAQRALHAHAGDPSQAAGMYAQAVPTGFGGATAAGPVDPQMQYMQQLAALQLLQGQQQRPAGFQ